MKKVCFTAVAACAMLFSTQNTVAQEIPQVEVEATVEQRVQEEYRKIEVQDLPEAVKLSLERDFAGAVISEAYVMEDEGEEKFKIKVTTVDGEEKELHADAEGNWIKKDEEQDSKDIE